MKKIILCSTSRNHLRFLIPLIEKLCKRSIVLLYCNLSEITNDSLYYKLIQLQGIYKTLMVMDLSDTQNFESFAKQASCLLVTTGTSIQWHKFEYDLCNRVPCKTYALQHGVSQEGITRFPEYNFSADKVITWVKDEYILDNVSTPREKFIPIGVPDHFYEEIEQIENSKMFFMTSFFDIENSQDDKIFRKIYNEDWKEETWDKIDELCSGDGVYFIVRHPAVERPNVHPKFLNIARRENVVVVDTDWLRRNQVSRSQLFSLASEYYTVHPSSTYVDCLLNGLDYTLFADYNKSVYTKECLQSLNATNQICKLLLK